MTDKKELTKLIYAMTLGDGSLGLRNVPTVEVRQHERPQYDRPSNSWYSTAQLIEHKDYLDWQISILSEITSAKLYKYSARKSLNGYIDSAKYNLETKRHPFFTTMRNRIYVNGKKQLSPHDLKLLDYQMLAILYMDDGWIEKTDKSTLRGCAIATHSFTSVENKYLRDLIAEKLGIHFDVKPHKQRNDSIKYYLRANRVNAERMIEKIYSYVMPSFLYKLDVSVERPTPNKNLGDDMI